MSLPPYKFDFDPMYAGDTFRALALTITSDEVGYTMTGAQAAFTVALDPDVAPVISKTQGAGLTLSGDTLTIDAMTLPTDGGDYRYSLSVTVGGVKTTLLYGKFPILKRVA